MSGNSILLDINIVLYLLNGDKTLADLLYKQKLYLSFINQFELLGFKSIIEHQQREINKFIKDCIVIDINEEIKNGVIEIRKTSKLRLPDSILLATARFLSIPVITSDIDFKSSKSSEVLLYK
jgi:predicted nucleic acid-binding protein